jgi:hypothetical protein
MEEGAAGTAVGVPGMVAVAGPVGVAGIAAGGTAGGAADADGVAVLASDSAHLRSAECWPPRIMPHLQSTTRPRPPTIRRLRLSMRRRHTHIRRLIHTR